MALVKQSVRSCCNCKTDVHGAKPRAFSFIEGLSHKFAQLVVPRLFPPMAPCRAQLMKLTV
eukprot:6963206-Pyramimonas_sp.AAC.1